MNDRNEMSIRFDSYSANEGFARVAVAAFLADMDPTLDELADVKTAVSEAVTNSIIHGYENRIGKIYLTCAKEKQQIRIEVVDYGKGIEDVPKAKEPFYTTRPELERSGMGFAFMEAFMDDVEVDSAPGQGTTVRMVKQFGTGA
ncbi:Anti-sigma F factor [Eubacterium plexicaudatum ASF492]|uniref:Anti-sigma F factor n=1 Tax=Eubacterium plexicaudatum ASF492 TaxID=1235802 RepID=N2AQT4_9FIRM|nr:Anti-sigma F factor [Eubacterium plexicaudatum ASF492]